MITHLGPPTTDEGPLRPPFPPSTLTLAFFLSGMTGLIYEVVWSRYLTLFVGGTAAAHAIVLSTFMAGLACGNAAFGRWADRPRASGLRLYALLEVGVGVACMLFPAAFGWLSELYVAIASRTGPAAEINAFLKIGLAATSMFLPCALMGGTLPALARHVVESLSSVGAHVSRLYFVNTAGAVVGCLLGGFYVVEHWGLEAGMVGTSLLNIAIGGSFYVIARRDGDRPPREPTPAAGEGGSSPETNRVYDASQVRTAFACVAGAGALSMLYELAWTRLLVLSIGPTVHSFSTMLASFISGIAIGSALAGRLMKKGRDPLALFGLCEVGIAVSIALSLPVYPALPFCFYRVGSALAHARDTYPVFLLAQAAIAWLLMLVPTTLMGAALPLASRVCVDRLDAVGRRVGDVFSANTAGTVAGAAVAGFALLPFLGLHVTLLLGVAGSGLLGVVLLRAWRREGADAPARGLADALGALPPPAGPRLWPSAVAALVLLGALGSSAGWDPRLIQAGLYRWERGLSFSSWASFTAFVRQRNFIFSSDGSDATVAVEQVGDDRQILVNGKPDASSGPDLPTQLMIGHLGMLLHPAPRRAMVVGLGSGTTGGAVLRHAGATVEVAEISPAVAQAARHFDFINDRVLGNPRMSLHVLDGREYLLLSPHKYDVVVSQPTNLWVPGVSSLFTRDFYALVDSRLERGGLLVQWIQLYSIDPETVASVLASLHAVFPYVTAWFVEDADLILVAGRERPKFDPDAFAQRLALARPADGMPKRHGGLALFRHPLLFLSRQIATGEDVRLYWPPASAPALRDALPSLEFRAARSQFLARPFLLFEELHRPFARLGREPLLLEEYLARHPLTPDSRKTLASILSALSPPQARLGRAINLREAIDGDPDPELLLSLGPELAGKALLSRKLGGEIDRKAQAAGVCQAYLAAHGELLRQAASVFGRPATTLFEGRIEACIARDPEAALGLRARLAKALAEAGADDTGLARIRALVQDGGLERLAARERAELLAFAAGLELRAGRRDEALLWAERAVRVEPENRLAARVLSALRPANRRSATSSGPGIEAQHVISNPSAARPGKAA